MPAARDDARRKYRRELWFDSQKEMAIKNHRPRSFGSLFGLVIASPGRRREWRAWNIFLPERDDPALNFR